MSRSENMSVEFVFENHSIVSYRTKDKLFCIYSTNLFVPDGTSKQNLICF